MRALLDVNVWIALFDDAHQFSERANRFISQSGVKIATCPLVENGVIRVMGSPHYSRRGALSIQLVRDRLRQACHELDHEFWPDDVSLREDERFNFARVQGHNQITDLYLLALAVHRKGCLVGFDQGIALSSVNGAAAQHVLML
jgi:toxin-antitoxin system PIN domain toxin